MSYQHMFYGVDLERLQGLYASANETFVAGVLQDQAEALEAEDMAAYRSTLREAVKRKVSIVSFRH